MRGVILIMKDKNHSSSNTQQAMSNIVKNKHSFVLEHRISQSRRLEIVYAYVMCVSSYASSEVGPESRKKRVK